MKFRLLMMVALAATLTAAACGGDDDDADTNGDVTQAAGGETPSGGTTGDGTATPATAATAGEGDDVSELLADASDKTYLVTYEVEFTESGKTQTGGMTFAQEPPKSFMKIALSGNEDFEELMIIEDGTSSFTCFKSGDSGQCLKAGAGGLGENFTLFDMKKVTQRVKDDKGVKEVAGQKIAGRNSRCFEGTFDDTAESSLVCIDKGDGILTLVESETTKIKATEISTKVDDKLFEPPYPVIG